MFIKAADFKSPKVTANVCVIGSGAAGLILTKVLAEEGMTVVLIDGHIQESARCPSDGYFPPGSSQDYEGLQGDFLDCTAKDVPMGQTWMTSTRKQTLGGSTNCWASHCIPLQKVDYAPPRLPGLSWPFDDAKLHDYYEAATSLIGIGPMKFFDLSTWTEKGYEDPLKGQKYLQTVIAQQAQSQYWKFQCLFQDTLKLKSVQVLSGGRATAFDISAKKVEAVTGIYKDGTSFRVEAGRYVLAAGGVENIRLLLCGNRAYTSGIGNNQADMLGKFFAVHPLIGGAARVNGTNPSFGGIIAKPPGQQLPFGSNIMAWVALTPDAMAEKEIANARVYLDDVDGETRVNLNWQQVSNVQSTISRTSIVDPTTRLNKVKVDWRLTQQDFRTASTMLDLVEEFLTSVDKTWTLSDRFDGKNNSKKGTCVCDGAYWFPYERMGGKGIWAAEHHMGATRMSKDPDDGIVDPDCKIHTIENLYVAGSSVFPQCGFANPTFTIIAMAIRLAKHLTTIIR